MVQTRSQTDKPYNKLIHEISQDMTKELNEHYKEDYEPLHGADYVHLLRHAQLKGILGNLLRHICPKDYRKPVTRADVILALRNQFGITSWHYLPGLQFRDPETDVWVTKLE